MHVKRKPALGKRRSSRPGGCTTAALLRVARCFVISSTAVFLTTSLAFAAETKKTTYEDDVLPIFRDNCLKCHNPDKLKGDLDLTSFSSAIKGGGSGATLNAGDPDGSQLYKSITHIDEPSMPPNAKLSDRDIGVIKQWIEGGLLQGVNSKAIAANKPAVDLALKSVSVGKPEGPPPMPGMLPLDPLVHSSRGSALSAVASSPWAPVVALAGARQIVFYNTADLEFIGVLPFAEGFPCDVKFSRNGKLLLASGGRGGQSGAVVVWDITTGERVITVGDQFDSVLAADLSSDQQWIALGGPDRVLKIYNTKDGALEHRIKKHTEWITAIEFSPDSKYLATGDRNGGVVLWEAESGQEMFNLVGHKGAITALTWRGDSALFASASEDGTVKLWKSIDGSSLRSIPAHSGGSLSARFTHDGRIATCGRDNKVQIWDTGGKNVRTLPFTGDLPNCVTFSDDGQKVIASDWKGAVYVWDAKTGKALGELDAGPPTLAERVTQGAQRLAKFQAAVDQAVAVQRKVEAESKSTQAKLDQVKKSLADARGRLTAAGGDIIKFSQQLADDPANEAAKMELVKARERIAIQEAIIAAVPKEIGEATKQTGIAAKKAAEANAEADEARAKLVSAKAALTRWQTALQNAQAKSRAGKVSAQP